VNPLMCDRGGALVLCTPCHNVIAFLHKLLLDTLCPDKKQCTEKSFSGHDCVLYFRRLFRTSRDIYNRSINLKYSENVMFCAKSHTHGDEGKCI
jgi:hypothetical protein